MKIANIIIGFIFGIIVTGTTIWLIMPGMMLTERASPFSLDETIEKISSNAQAEGWIVSSIQPAITQISLETWRWKFVSCHIN